VRPPTAPPDRSKNPWVGRGGGKTTGRIASPSGSTRGPLAEVIPGPSIRSQAPALHLYPPAAAPFLLPAASPTCESRARRGTQRCFFSMSVAADRRRDMAPAAATLWRVWGQPALRRLGGRGGFCEPTGFRGHEEPACWDRVLNNTTPVKRSAPAGPPPRMFTARHSTISRGGNFACDTAGPRPCGKATEGLQVQPSQRPRAVRSRRYTFRRTRFEGAKGTRPRSWIAASPRGLLYRPGPYHPARSAARRPPNAPSKRVPTSRWTRWGGAPKITKRNRAGRCAG